MALVRFTRETWDVIIEPPQSILPDYSKGCKGNCHQGNPGSGLVKRADGRHSEGTSDQCRAVHRPWEFGNLGTWEPWKSEWITRGPHPFQNLRISSNSVVVPPSTSSVIVKTQTDRHAGSGTIGGKGVGAAQTRPGRSFSRAAIAYRLSISPPQVGCKWDMGVPGIREIPSSKPGV